MLAKPSVKIRTTPSEVFKNIAKMIHASSIMTPRNEFLYCKPDDTLDNKLREMEKGPFDVIPLLEGEDLETGYITKYLYQETIKQKIEQGYIHCRDAAIEIEDEDRIKSNLPLERLIGGFPSRRDKPKIPYFTVNSVNQIEGLITLADLDKVAVKTYLFSLISELELSLLDIISKRYENLKTVCKCKYCQQKRAKRKLNANKRRNTEDKLEEYYYLNLREVLHIVTHSDMNKRIGKTGKGILKGKDYDDIVQLRNTVAHVKPLVSGKFPINRLIKTHNLIKSLISATKN